MANYIYKCEANEIDTEKKSEDFYFVTVQPKNFIEIIKLLIQMIKYKNTVFFSYIVSKKWYNENVEKD